MAIRKTPQGNTEYTGADAAKQNFFGTPKQETTQAPPPQQDNKVHTFVHFNKDGTVTTGGQGLTSTTQSKQDYNATNTLGKAKTPIDTNIPSNAQALANKDIVSQKLAGTYVSPEQQAQIDLINQQEGVNPNPEGSIGKTNVGGIISQGLERGFKEAAVAGTTAAAAGLATGGTLSVPLAIAGSIGGFVHGSLTGGFEQFKAAKIQDVKANYAVYKGEKRNMGVVINNVNHLPNYSPENARIDWINQKNQIYQVRANLHAYYLENPSVWAAKGQDEEATVNAFIEQFPTLDLSLEQAIARRNPNAPLVNFNEAEVLDNG